jgi:hypothetical protein
MKALKCDGSAGKLKKRQQAASSRQTALPARGRATEIAAKE